MQGKCLNDHAGQRTFLLVLETGDAPMAGPQALATAERLTTAPATPLALIDPVAGT